MSYPTFVYFRTLATQWVAPARSLDENERKGHKGTGFAAGVLLALTTLFTGPALATTTINHQFTPATINPGDLSKYRITLSNDDTGSALSGAKVTVILQPQISIASLAGITNTCGFTVNQPTTTGGATIELSGGSLEMAITGVAKQCYFEIDVTSTSDGNWINTIPVNPITGAAPGTPTITPNATTMGYLATTAATGVLVANTTPADATLAVSKLDPPSGTKTFSPSPAYAGNPVTLTITLSNPNAAATMPLTTLTDILPAGMVVDASLGASTSCSGTGSTNGTLTATTGSNSITLTGGTIGNSGTCTISVPVVVPTITGTTQAFDNTLAAGAIGNTRGLSSLAFNKSLTVNTPISIAKSFSVGTIPAGQPSLMTLTVNNRSSVNSLDISAFTDNLTGTTLQVLTMASSPVVAPADPAISCTGSGAVNGTLTTVADTLDTTISLANAAAGPSGACTITAYVTSYVDGAHPNTTSKVTNPTRNYDSTPASASLTSVAQLRVTKSVSVSSVAPGQWTEFTVTIKNYTGVVVDNLLFKDLLPSNGVKQMVVFDPVGSTSGIYVTDAGCSGGTWTGLNTGGASTGSAPVSGVDAGLQWSLGSIVAGSGASPGVCTIKIRAQLPTATTGMTFTNTIPQDSITGKRSDNPDAVTNPDTSGSSTVTTIDAVAVSKGFAPASMAQGGLSTLTINIYNRVLTPNSPISAINLTDTLPSGVVLAANPAPTNTCGGTLQAFPGATQVILSGGTFAVRPDASQQASCKITVQVTASALGTYTNTIAPANFTSSAGTISASATANLAVTAGITGGKNFSPTSVTSGGTARVTITLNNIDNSQLTNVSVDDDNFGSGLLVANPANAATSCAGSPTLVVNPGQARAQLLGATLNAGASCTFSFDVGTSGSGPWSNTVASGKVSSAEGVSNAAAFSANLTANTASIGINKSFLTPVVTGGVPSVLQIDVTNSSSVAIHSVGFTDTFPLGIQVYSVPAASTTCAGGTVTAVSGDGKIVLSGATLAANATCKVLVTTTSVKFLNLTNTIPASSVTSAEGYTNPLATSASLSTLQGLGVMKGFEPAYIAANGVSRLKVTLVSTFDPNAVVPTNLTGVSFTDALPIGVTLNTPLNLSTTCSNGSGGSAMLTAAGDNKSLTLSGATIPAGSLCVIEANVTASALGTYVNTISKDGVTSTQGVTNQTAATANLSVVNQPTIGKAFSTSPVQVGVVSKLTVTISNGSGVALSGIALSDTLPTGLAIANTPNAATTCSNGVVSAWAGDDVLSLAGATLASGASCTFSADVLAGSAGSYANTIAPSKLVNDQGLSNPGAASATLVVVPPASVSKRFNPASIAANGTSTLTITLSNGSASEINLTADLVDALPGNVLVAPTPNLGGTCAGTKTAIAGGTTVRLASGATIPAVSSCTVTVNVTSSVTGSYVNVIAAGQMQTSAGKNQDPAIATLGVDVLAPPTMDKAFSPTTILAGGTSTLTITLGNDNTVALTLSSDFTDTLPTNVVVAATPAIGGSCTGLVTAAGSTITYASGATIPASGCTITVNVTSSTVGSYTNTIATTALVTNAGSPPLPAEAGLVVKSLTPPGVRKSFSPGTINPGGISTLTINLDNDNASALTLAALFTDTLPANVVVATSPNIGGTCTTGSVSASGSTITYANSATIPASGGCTITVDVTSSVPGGPYTNSVAAGALVTTEAGSNSGGAVASLFVTPFQPPSVSKTFSNALLPKQGTSTLTISLGNGNAAAISLSADFVDTLPGTVVIATPNGLQTSAGCDNPSSNVLATPGNGTITYKSGATLAGNGGCTIQVNVTSTAATAALSNTIASGALQTSAGNNAVGATAPIQFVDWPVDADLSLSKAIAPGTGVAGDTQTVTLTWSNTNAASPTKNVYQCVISDPLPVAAFDKTTITAGTTPSGYTFGVSNNTISYTRTDTTTPCETTTQTATFTVKLQASVVTGSTYVNTATLTAKTLPSNDANVAAATTLNKSASANVVVSAPSTSAKTVVSTSQNFTDASNSNKNANPPVAIGETVTYSIPFNLPPGVTNAVTLADEITTGIGDVELVSATLARSSANLSAANDLASINSAAVNVPVDVTSVIVGNEFRFSLGNVSNTGVAASYTLTITLRIANVASNVAGHTITDQGLFRYQDAVAPQFLVTTTGTMSVHVALPVVQLSKSVSPAAPAGGDTVTYTLTLKNNSSGANAADGYGWTFSDVLPGQLSPGSFTVTTNANSRAVTGSFTGNTLNGTIDLLLPGETVVVQYTATVSAATPFGATITNSATASTTTIPSAQPDEAGERSGSGGVNNLSATASATMTTSLPTMTKTVLTPQSYYAIGDLVHYRVTVAVPGGSTTNFTLTDALPTGLAYVSGSAKISSLTGGVTTPSVGVLTPTSTSPLTLALGTIGATAAGSLLIDFDAQVSNVRSNQNNTTLTNSVNAVYDNPAGGAQLALSASAAAIKVGEPNLTMSKSIVSGATGSVAASTVRWQLSVANTGSVTAYQQTISDRLPNHLHNLSVVSVTPSGGNIQANNAGCSGGATVSTANAVVSTTTNSNDTLEFSTLCLAPGATLTVQYDSAVMNTAVAGEVLTNTLTSTYASQVAGRSNSAVVRDGADSDTDDDSFPSSGTCDGTTVKCNNANESASSALTIGAAVAIDKLADKTTATLGETVTYTIKVSVIEGVTPNVVVRDLLPTGLTYVSHAITLGRVGMTLGNATYNTREDSGQSVQFTLGDIGNNANGNAGDDYVTMAITARVDNSVANQKGTILHNGEGSGAGQATPTVTVAYGSGSTTTLGYDHDTGTSGYQGLPLTITEPALTLTKNAAPLTQSLGDEVMFTLTLQHDGANSNATAFDLAVSDTLPAGLTYVTGSTSPAANEPAVSGQVLTFPPISSLTTGAASTTLIYRARVDTSTAVGTLLTNSAGLTWKSQSGATGAASSGRTGPLGGSDTLNDYKANSTASVTSTAAAFISAQKTVVIQTDGGTVGVADPGDTLRYTITLKNTGSITATNTVLTDAIPANTSYAGNLTSSVGTASTVGSAPVTGISVAVGSLAPAATVTIRFDVSINSATPVGTVIGNQGRVDSEQTVPKPTDADGNPANGDQPTTILVGGGPGVLYANKFVSLLGDADSSGTITAGDTMRYALIVKNTGGTALASALLTDPIPSGLTATGTPSATQGSITVTAGTPETITWTIGALAAGQTVTAYFDVTINAFSGSPTFSNQGSVSADSVSTIQTDGNGDPVDGAQPTLFKAGAALATLDVQKRWALAVDTAPFGVTSPGDTLQYTLTVSNSGSAPATNVRLNDPQPTCSGVLTACTTYVSGSLTSSQGAIVSESPQDVNMGTLAPGGFVTLSYSVLVDPATANGVVIANQARVTFTEGGPVLSDDNGSPLDGTNPTLTPVSTVAGGSGYPSALSKQLVGSSESTSSGASVLIGEVLRYRISITLPKGATKQVRLVDELPVGLAYLPGSARLARTFETGLSASANPGGINSAVSGTGIALVDGTSIFLGSGAGGTGTLDVFLGDVINSDANTTTPEMYTLEYRALVRNDVGNQAGTALANAATVRFVTSLNQAQSLTPVTATQTISEAAIVLSKAAAPASLPTTGGATEFTLNIGNPAGANVASAFDLVLSDVLPAVFTSIGARSIVSSGATSVVDTSTGASVGLTIAQLDPGGNVSVRFTATAPGPVLAAVPIVNNANLTWTSLPGSSGSAADGVATPGTAGNGDGERIGTGGVNDYTKTAAATVTVPINGVAIAKSLVNAQTRYAIGDPVSYRVDFTVPGAAYGPVPGVVVSDILAAGLTYVPGSLLIAYNGVNASTPPVDFARTDNTPASGQETLLATFGTLTNSNAGGATVTLTYRATVDNLLVNQANTSLLNQASLTFSDTGSGSVSATRGPVTTSVTVGEPFLTLSKTLTSSAVGMMAGSPASFSVTVGNTGTTTAFETLLSDTLPAGLFFPAGSAVSVITSNLSGNLQAPTVSVSTGAWQTSAFDLPVGDSVTFTFAATLGASVQPGQTLQNSVAATYSSRDGTDPNERNGTTSGALQTDDTLRDNYNIAASAAPLTVADPIAIAKAFYPSAASNRYAVGQLVTYRLTLSVLEGTTRSVRISDTLPAGLSFVSAGSPGTSPGTPIAFTYAGLPTVSGQVVSFDLGDVVNPANGSGADDFITIDLTARVDNTLNNQNGTLLGNHLRVTFVDSAGVTRTRDFDADAVTSGVQPLNLTVLEPVLALTKKVSPASQSLGELVTFTLTVAHTAASRADAYNVLLVDTLPAGLVFEPDSVNPAGLFGTSVGQTLTLNVGTLSLAGASRTITYQARLRASVQPGAVQTNTVHATWGSIPGATGAADSGRNGSSGSSGLNDYTASAQVSLAVLANIVGTVFNDIDANGVQEAGDAGLGGVTVTLKDASGAVVSTRATAADGSYSFLGIPAGSYTVLQTDLSGYSSSTTNTLLLTVPAGGVGIANFGDLNGNVKLPASIAVNKTLYGGHSKGAGCPGSKELVVVDALKAPVKITWCFEVSNTSQTHLTNLLLDDPKLGISAKNQGLLVLRSGTFPLAPGAKAIWYYEDTRTTSLPNAVTVTATPSNSAGIPTGQPVTQASDSAAVFAYVFDPPFGLKTGKLLSGQPVIRWTMVWINGSPIVANGVVITDSPPADTTYRGNLVCTPQGSTTVSQCSFEAPSAAFPRGRVKVISNIGPDYGQATEASAANELLIGFDVTLDDPTIARSYLNQGDSSWDPTASGTPLRGITDDPSINGVVDPTPVLVSGVSIAGIPTLSEWGVIVLSGLMGLFGFVQMRRRIR